MIPQKSPGNSIVILEIYCNVPNVVDLTCRLEVLSIETYEKQPSHHRDMVAYVCLELMYFITQMLITFNNGGRLTKEHY